MMNDEEQRMIDMQGHVELPKVTPEERVAQLEAAIIKVVTQQADDLCWMDVYTELAHLVGRSFDPLLLPVEQMDKQCQRFVRSLHAGCPYQTDCTTLSIREIQRKLTASDDSS